MAPDKSDLALADASSILGEPSHPFHDWVEVATKNVVKVRYQKGKVFITSMSDGSGIVLNDRSGARLFLSAWHVLAAIDDHPAPLRGVWNDSLLHLPTEHSAHVPLVTRPHLDSDESTGVIVFAPEISAAEFDGGRLTELPMVKDFVVGSLERQVVTSFVPAVDTAPSRAALAGDRVLMTGFTKNLRVSTGAILPDDRAAKIVAEAPSERRTPYDPSVEWIVTGEVVFGMSGGPAFDRYGNLIGLILRASIDSDGPVRFARVLKLDALVALAERVRHDNACAPGLGEI